MKNAIQKRRPVRFRSGGALPHITGTGGVRTWWGGLYHRFNNWRALRRSRKALLSLNDTQLRDIGLTRDDLPDRDEARF